MWIVLTALRRPYTFVVLAVVIALFGVRAAVQTPTDIFPNINIPVVSVVWTYNGLLPNDYVRPPLRRIGADDEAELKKRLDL